MTFEKKIDTDVMREFFEKILAFKNTDVKETVEYFEGEGEGHLSVFFDQYAAFLGEFIHLNKLLSNSQIFQNKCIPWNGAQLMLVVSVESLAQSMLLNHGPGPRGLYDKSIPSFNDYGDVLICLECCQTIKDGACEIKINQGNKLLLNNKCG